MQNVRVLSKHERALLAHKSTFGGKIARFDIFQFYVIKINHRLQIGLGEFTPQDFFFFRHLTIRAGSKYYRFHDKNFLGNHKCTDSHYI